MGIPSDFLVDENIRSFSEDASFMKLRNFVRRQSVDEDPRLVAGKEYIQEVGNAKGRFQIYRKKLDEMDKQ